MNIFLASCPHSTNPQKTLNILSACSFEENFLGLVQLLSDCCFYKHLTATSWIFHSINFNYMDVCNGIKLQIDVLPYC